jgi:hypothetical protein
MSVVYFPPQNRHLFMPITDITPFHSNAPYFRFLSKVHEMFSGYSGYHIMLLVGFVFGGENFSIAWALLILSNNSGNRRFFRK